MSSNDFQEFSDAIRDHYEVERELGRGGMATVYLARDIKLDRRVAIKVLHPDLAAAVGGERFKREIEIASTLNHPHILPLYDSGEAKGKLYYVMPFVAGESLAARLERERQLPIEDALKIACEVASALNFAHKHNILHRDIKPENILLEEGVAIVADFGIARVVGATGEGAALTQTGMSVGTPTYMSPEQALADKGVDGRSDQYSLACVLYEMLAGQPPFTGGSMQVLIMRHTMEQVPSLRIQRQTVSEDLEAVILRALAKSPADRFPSMAAFAEALQAPHGMTASWQVTRAYQVQGPPKRSPLVKYGAMAAVLAVFATGATIFANARGGADAGTLVDTNTPVAVLYFEDQSPDSSLGPIADGLTEALIERLSPVPELKLVSLSGIAPFRGDTASPETIASRLSAKTLVTGSVQPLGDKVRITVRLYDGFGKETAKGSFDQSATDAVAMRDTLATRVELFLRQQIGESVQLAASRNQTTNSDAWLLVQQGQRLVREALAGNRDNAAEKLARADSLLASAATRDRQWASPVAERSRIAYQRARLFPPGPESRQWAETAIAVADSALLIDPKNSSALEARGTARYYLWQAQLITEADQAAAMLTAAETDLRAAAEGDPRNASSLSVLSHLLSNKPDFAEAYLAANEAYRRDPYLTQAAVILERLYRTSYMMQNFEKARQWCDVGRGRFPQDNRFYDCALWLMATGRNQSPDSAWKLLKTGVELAQERRRPYLERQGQIAVAIVLGKAGQADSARRVLVRARADQDIDPTGELLYYEAFARLTLGEQTEALRLLKQYLTRNPDHLEGMGKDSAWWWRDLEQNEEYQRLIRVGAAR